MTTRTRTLPSQGRRSLTLMIAAALVTACGEDPPLATQPRSSDAQSAAVAGGSTRPGEQLFADLAARAPSSAGMYFDDAGTLVVRVRDARDGQSARAAAAALVSGGRVHLARGQAAPSIVIRPAQFTYAQLSAWRNSIGDEVLGNLLGITWLDLDEVNNVVSLGINPVSFDATRGKVLSELARLGIPPSAVRFVAAKPIPDASARTAVTSATVTPPCGALNSDACNPVAGGVQIQRAGNWTCSLAFVAQYQGVTGFVSGSHCTSHKFGVNGDVIHQAHFSATNPQFRIGLETADPSGWTCGIYTCRRSDAAFFTFDTPSAGGLGLITRPSTRTGAGGTLPPNPELINLNRPFLFVAGTVDSYGLLRGQQVEKIGTTTGWTYGTVTMTCVDYLSTEGSEPGWIVKILCTDQTNAPAQGGDSGGPAFTWDGADRVILAGVTVANPGGGALYSRFSQIELDFGGPGVFSVLPTDTLPRPVLSGAVVNQRASLSWTPVAGADRYTVTIYAWFTACDDWGCQSYPSTTYATTTGTSFVDNDAAHKVTGVITPYSFGSEIHYSVAATSDARTSRSSNIVAFSWVWWQ